MQQQSCTFIPASGVAPLNYLLALPPDYQSDSTERWPLLLFLHGRGECGDDLALVKRYGVPKLLTEVDDFPFITVSPQCPAGTDWALHNTTLLALVDEIMATHPIDPNRIYLTGLSMGGRGSWQLAMLYPECFAAMAPICGRIPDVPGFLEQMATLKDLPIWVFHGAQDPVVPLENSEKLVAALYTCHGNVRFTVYPHADHDAWTKTYANPELYEWMIAHSRPAQKVKRGRSRSAKLVDK